MRRLELVIVLALGLGSTVRAQVRADQPLPQLDGVGVSERLGDTVPLDRVFTSAEGARVTLAEIMKVGKPVILTLNYSSCPMLCSLQLSELVKALEQMPWTLGDQYQVVTLSLDPTETAARALATKQRYLGDYRRAAAGEAWHFLTGAEEDVRAVAEAVGFGYRYDPERKEYLHQAAVMVLSPSGVVSRYLYGVVHSPATLRLSLVEASQGKLASTIDKIVLFCFHYDAATGRYAPAARNLMRAGGALTVLALGAFLGTFWWRERKRAVRVKP